ncbi:hypothetical protein [Devosia nitrariae]|uniref:Uncharacterized protein n=1 Tax=Devosia nitrariae TaxID=2071872 RepID=A0ABQ5W1H7_9HYPH|nr:hypothetical protein [Devosia nitrariae]GLQ53752.1 hypothetical protein GCM10010862_10110 [Devosia nitrariae]
MDETKPTQPFVWGANGAAVSPEQIARRLQVAAALIKGGADLSPVGHWTQGLARLAQGGLGGLLAYRADELERARGVGVPGAGGPRAFLPEGEVNAVWSIPRISIPLDF